MDGDLVWFLCSWLYSLYQLITGPQSDRPSSLLLLILWLFWGLFQSLPQMQEFLNVFFFFFPNAPPHMLAPAQRGASVPPTLMTVVGWEP